VCSLCVCNHIKTTTKKLQDTASSVKSDSHEYTATDSNGNAIDKPKINGKGKGKAKSTGVEG
jgi:hypothetical protein